MTGKSTGSSDEHARLPACVPRRRKLCFKLAEAVPFVCVMACCDGKFVCMLQAQVHKGHQVDIIGLVIGLRLFCYRMVMIRHSDSPLLIEVTSVLCSRWSRQMYVGIPLMSTKQ